MLFDSSRIQRWTTPPDVGGRDYPDDGCLALRALIQIGVFSAKVIALCWLQLTIRWTLPRFRYDQVMRLGWKMILPLSLANIMVTGLVILLLN